ncbi:MAG: hypothetical protein PF487_06170 [Bacteroidales bacterium]|jgi:hypothetical protein|nr:hypothetical protein [Bacteroidales bacterium]
MNRLVISIIIILIPGIIATIISDKLTYHSKWDSFKFSLYSLVLGVLSYSILQIIIYSRDILYLIINRDIKWTHLNIWNCATNENIEILPLEVIFAALISLGVGFIASWVINTQFLNKIANKLGVSYKYGDENLYSYYLNKKEIDWIYIRDYDRNTLYQGRIQDFSENTVCQEIVLNDVSVYQNEDSVKLYDIPTLYISRKIGNLVIEEIPKENLGEKNE